MTDERYQDAVQILRDRIGTRWEGSQDEGRDEMVKILRSQPGFDSNTADDTIDALIESGKLHYHSTFEPAVPIASPGAIPSPLAGSPAPVAPVGTLGYWQIGDEETDDVPGRAGQITPS